MQSAADSSTGSTSLGAAPAGTATPAAAADPSLKQPLPTAAEEAEAAEEEAARVPEAVVVVVMALLLLLLLSLRLARFGAFLGVTTTVAAVGEGGIVNADIVGDIISPEDGDEGVAVAPALGLLGVKARQGWRVKAEIWRAMAAGTPHISSAAYVAVGTALGSILMVWARCVKHGGTYFPERVSCGSRRNAPSLSPAGACCLLASPSLSPACSVESMLMFTEVSSRGTSWMYVMRSVAADRPSSRGPKIGHAVLRESLMCASFVRRCVPLQSDAARKPLPLPLLLLLWSRA